MIHDLKPAISRTARRLGCEQAVQNLDDVSAVRMLQVREGYTPCFGRDEPLRPLDPTHCAESRCRWLSACDLYRAETPAIHRKLLELADSRDQLFGPRSVGVKFASFDRLPAVTRKMAIAAPQSVFGEFEQKPGTLKPHLLGSKVAYEGPPPDMDVFHVVDVLFTSDFDVLRAWFIEAMNFLEDGTLAYYPLVHSQRTYAGGVPTNPAVGEAFHQGQLRALKQISSHLPSFPAPHLGFPDGQITLTDANIAPILNIELPVLEEASLDVIHQLMKDHPDELCSFRDLLYASVQELGDAAVGSVGFQQDCYRIERQIRQHLRKLKSDLRKSTLKAAISLTGCCVAAWTLTLYCFVPGQHNALTILGPGGLAYTVATAYREYLVEKLALKDNPVYFLWLIGNSRRA